MVDGDNINIALVTVSDYSVRGLDNDHQHVNIFIHYTLDGL